MHVTIIIQTIIDSLVVEDGWVFEFGNEIAVWFE